MKRGIALLVMCAAATLSASEGPPMTLEARARGAEIVVVASVADISSWFDRNRFGDQLIVSQVALNVEEALKGKVPHGLAMQIEGGTVGGLTLQVSDLPHMTRGDRAVLFLEHAANGALVPHRRGLGILMLSGNTVAGTDISLSRVRQTVRQAAGQ